MLHMIRGCQVPCPEALQEGFEKGEHHLFASLDAEHIDPVFRAFLRRQREELFFFLELPTNFKIQKELWEERRRSGIEGTPPFYLDVYYWDGISLADALSLLDRYGELLIHDGMCSFGFGVRSFSAELQKGKYNCVTLYAADLDAYDDFFPSLGVEQVEELRTAWDCFDAFDPGDCFTIQVDGVTIYDLPELLKGKGLYFAERREED